MKKLSIIIFTAFVCFALTGEAYAQRCLPGMKGIQVSGGLVDGVSGHYFGVSMTTYAKRTNKWIFGAEYLQINHSYKDISIPVAQFTGEGGYYYKFLSDHNKTFLLYLGGSAMAGYETVNWGKKELFDGSSLENKDKFIFGGAISLNLDTYITNRLILFLSARERILWGTSTGHFHTQYGIGLKYIFN